MKPRGSRVQTVGPGHHRDRPGRTLWELGLVGSLRVLVVRTPAAAAAPPFLPPVVAGLRDGRRDSPKSGPTAAGEAGRDGRSHPHAWPHHTDHSPSEASADRQFSVAAWPVDRQGKGRGTRGSGVRARGKPPGVAWPGQGCGAGCGLAPGTWPAWPAISPAQRGHAARRSARRPPGHRAACMMHIYLFDSSCHGEDDGRDPQRAVQHCLMTSHARPGTPPRSLHTR